MLDMNTRLRAAAGVTPLTDEASEPVEADEGTRLYVSADGGAHSPETDDPYAGVYSGSSGDMNTRIAGAVFR